MAISTRKNDDSKIASKGKMLSTAKWLFPNKLLVMQFYRMLKLQVSKFGDASTAFTTSLNPHQHLTCQPSVDD